MDFARAAVFEAPGRMVIKEFPLPEIGTDEILIEVEIAGVDGSEVHMFNGELEDFTRLAPVIMGDEVVGRVVAIGNNAKKRRHLKVGDRVTVESHWPCHECLPCLTGQYYLCNNGWQGHAYGWISCNEAPYLWGTYSTHVFVPKDALVYKIPEELPIEIAITGVSVLANGIRWVDRAEVKLGDSVVIFGPGPQGLMCSLVAKERGAGKVIMVGTSHDKERLEMAKKMGSDEVLVFDDNLKENVRMITNGRLADVVIETAGAKASLQSSLDVVRPGGTINHVSVTGWKEIPLMVQKIMFNEITFKGSIAHPELLPVK